MANLLKIKRGTRAQLNAAVTGNTLNLGEPYLITDEGRIAIGTGSNSFVDFAKSSEVQALDADLTAIAGLTGTGFLKRTGTDTWVLDTNTYLTAESDTLATVTGRGASTSTAVTFSGGLTSGSSGVKINGATSGTVTLTAPAAAGTTAIAFPATSGTVALTSNIPTVNAGTLTLQVGAAGATNTTLTVGTGTGFNANTATNATYSVSVGPALTALASTMTGAGSGFLKKTGADTYALDTNTYLTAESDTLDSVVGRGSSTSTAVTLGGGVTVGSTGVKVNGSTSGTATIVTSAVASTPTLTLPTTTGTIALTSDIPTVNNGALSVSIGTAGATNSTVTWGTSSGFTANASAASTYDLKVGPALTALASTMTGAGSGFLKKTAADTYTLDTSTYITGNQTITLSGDASGSGATAITVTLASVGTAGTYTKVTTDAKGRVTSGTTLAATDIPTLTASKISDFDTQVRTSRLDQMAAPAAAVALNSQKITGLADPTLAQDAATKAYVDSVAQGLEVKQSVRAATTANITLSATQTIDGIALAVGDRVLVKNQSTPAQNGIYVVASGAWTRSTDADTWNELISAFTFVEEGTVNADTGWVSTANAGGSLGTTAIAFSQFSGAGTYTAGNGLTLTGNSFAVGGTANRITVGATAVDIASTYVGQTSITTLGTIGTGTWNATAIGVTKGGLGLTAAVTGLLKGNGTSYSAAVAGTDYLDPNGTIDGGTF